MEERIIKDVNNLLTQLFQKMKEAGYELDGEKKELRKIELAKNESEEELSDFEAALFSAFSDGWQQYLHGEEVDMAQWAREHSAELLGVARDWKPSEEQMIYLKKVYESYDFCDGERCALESLYNDLKEL